MLAQGARILLVEDDYEVRTAMAELLREAGYDVIEATDGQTAIALAAATAPELVLLDLILPDAPGFELLGKLRGMPNGNELPIIAVSGFEQRTEEALSSGERFTAYLSKPFGADRLLEIVEQHLQPSPRS